MRRRTHRDQPARCPCEPGPDAAESHGRPGAKVAQHGNVFAHTGACVHSELSTTTKPMAKQVVVLRLRLQ